MSHVTESIDVFFQCRHQAREAEPKDYDISKAPKRDLCKATYGRIGDFKSGVSGTSIWNSTM